MNDNRKASRVAEENKPVTTTAPLPGLVTLEGDGLVCDAETGVCEIPQKKPDNAKANG